MFLNKFNKIFLFFISVYMCFSLTSCCGEKSQKSCGADELFKEQWTWTMETFPTYASMMNYGERHNRFFKETVENITKAHEETKTFYERSEKLLKTGKCQGRDQENLKLFSHQLSDEIEGFKFKTYLVKFQSMGGPHTRLPQLHNNIPLKTVQNYKDFLERLSQIPEVFKEAKALSLLGLKEGITAPKVTFQNYESPILDLSEGEAEKSPYFKAFEKFPEDFSEADKKSLAQEAKTLIKNKIQPAYKELYKFWVKDYYPNLREGIAASSLPDGKEYYKFRIRSMTTLDLTAEEIHATGKKEVARILAEMKELKNKLKFKGDLKAFFKDLRTNPKFYAKTKEELYKETTHILKIMDGKMPQLFKKLPRLTYGVEPIPDFIAHKSPAAYYKHGNIDLGKAGTYEINLSNLKSRPLYNLEALSLHEAVPGHHLQIALAQEIEDFPEFRKQGGVTAFIEGWGLYAESLGKLVGMYQDPYSDFGRLTYEQWRAMRLVVDTGIHAFGWNRQKAIDYMAAHSGLSLKNITTEVDRYINWPGQALAYKIGELKIKELRALTKKELGKKYDIRDFHDVVLGSGALPLKVLEEKVRAYIKKEKSKLKEA